MTVVARDPKSIVIMNGQRGPAGRDGAAGGDKGDKGDTGAPGAPGANSGTGANVSTRTGMADIPSPADRAAAILTEAGKAGQFTFDATPAVDDVTSDPDKMLTVAPSAAPSGSAGVWRRDHNNVFDLEWALNRGSDTPADTRAKLQRAVRLAGRNKGATLLWPARDIDLNDVEIQLDQPDVRHLGRGGVIRKPGGGQSGHCLRVMRGRVIVERFAFEGFQTIDNANARVCIDVTQVLGGDTTPDIGDIDNVLLEDIRFYDCDNPLRSGYSLVRDANNNVIARQVNDLTVNGFEAHDVGYQGFICFRTIGTKFNSPIIRMKTGIPYRPFMYPIRMVGPKDFRVTDPDIVGHPEAHIFGVMQGNGVVAPKDIQISGGRSQGGKGLLNVQGAGGRVRLADHEYANNTSAVSRGLLDTYVIIDPYNPVTDENWGLAQIEMENIRASGLSFIGKVDGPTKSISIKNTVATGNALASHGPFPEFFVAGGQFASGYDHLEIIGNQWLLTPRIDGVGVSCPRVKANSVTRVEDNLFPPVLGSAAGRRDRMVSVLPAAGATGARMYGSRAHSGQAADGWLADVSNSNGFAGANEHVAFTGGDTVPDPDPDPNPDPGPDPHPEITALFASNKPGVWWDIQDLSTLFQESTFATPAAVGQPVGGILDKSGRNNHMRAADGKRPILRLTSGKYYLEFDGGDEINTTSPITWASTSDVLIALANPSADPSYVVTYNQASSANNFIGAAVSGSSGSVMSGAGSATLLVNGAHVDPVTRGALHSAIGAGGGAVFEAQDAAIAYDYLAFGGYPTFEFTGRFYGLLVVDTANSASRATTRAYMASLY